MIFKQASKERFEKELDKLRKELRKLEKIMRESNVPEHKYDDVTGDIKSAINGIETEISAYESLKRGRRIAPVELKDLGDLIYTCVHRRKIQEWSHRDIYEPLGVKSSSLSQDIRDRFGNIKLSRAIRLFDVLKYEPFFHLIPTGENDALPVTLSGPLPFNEIGIALIYLQISLAGNRNSFATAIGKDSSWLTKKEKSKHLDSQLNTILTVARFFMKEYGFTIKLRVDDLSVQEGEELPEDEELPNKAYGTFNKNSKT